METLDKIKSMVEELSIESGKFFQKGNNSAGIRARQTAQELKSLLQKLRSEILIERKKDKNA